jgi:serine O-acetyltransferase
MRSLISIANNTMRREKSSSSSSTSTHSNSRTSNDDNLQTKNTGGGDDDDGDEPLHSQDEMFLQLRREAAAVVQNEPILAMLLAKVGLLDAPLQLQHHNNNYHHSSSSSTSQPIICACEPATSFEEIISRIVSHRLSSCSGGNENICPTFLRNLLEESFRNTNELEMGHTMAEATRMDALAIVRRDPACETLLEAVLFMKGFHSLVLHRAARRAWRPTAAAQESHDTTMRIEGVDVGGNSNPSDGNAKGGGGKRFVALLLQSQSSSAFGVDIHPAASIGAGVMIDHASGVVIGETATVGDGTTILHGVTLGGTGKDHGDRHPKIGRHVLIGAGTKILGNITVGDRAKIGAGSVVLRPIPSGATAVGAPAKIIGFIPHGELPGSTVDMNLDRGEPLLGVVRQISSASSSGSSGSTEAGTSTATVLSDDVKMEGSMHPHFQNEDQVADTESTSNVDDDDAEEKKDVSGEEDDDNVTDYGTVPKCRWVKVSNHNDELCPFSGLFRGSSSSVKNNSISHKELRALLIQEGCSEGECVEVFFQLLHCTPVSSKARQCGCIPLQIFYEHFPTIAKDKTKLDIDTIHALARGDLRALGLSKKASKHFKSKLGMLSEYCTKSVLPRLPSAASLKLDKCRLTKSEREQMGTHLDTNTFVEGISI